MRVTLKTAIISAYGTQSYFARAIQKSDDWVSRIISGRKNPTEKEKTLIISKLGEVQGPDNGSLFDNKEIVVRM